MPATQISNERDRTEDAKVSRTPTGSTIKRTLAKYAAHHPHERMSSNRDYVRPLEIMFSIWDV